MNARVISAALTALSALAFQASAQNLLINGDFEAGEANTPGAPNWSTFNGVFTDTDFFRTGEKALKMFGPFFVGGGAGGTQNVTAAAGDAFTLSGFFFTPSIDQLRGSNFVEMKIEFLNSANAVLGSAVQTVDSTIAPDVWHPLTVAGTAPSGTIAVRTVLVHVQINDPVTGGAVWFDDVSLVAGLPPPPTWITNGIGSWFDGSNWNAPVPNGVGAEARFHGAITADRTVVADQNVTLGILSFDNANRYNLAGNGTLTLDVASGSSTISVVQGSHKINLPLVVEDNVNAGIAAGANLLIADPLTLNNGSDINVAGGGTLEIISTVNTSPGAGLRLAESSQLVARTDLNGAAVAVDSGNASFQSNQRLASLSIGSESTAEIDAAQIVVVKTDALALTSSAKLEINNNGVIVDYTGASPLVVLNSLIASAFAGGDWSGPGITSNVAATNPSRGVGIAESTPGSFLGQPVDGTSVRIRATLKGDTDLNGAVEFADLLALAQAYNGTGTWANGDSDYSNSIEFADLLALAQNYGTTLLTGGDIAVDAALQASFTSDWARARSVIPEPTTLALLGLAGAAMLRRR
jgi:hypothetical protein